MSSIDKEVKLFAGLKRIFKISVLFHMLKILKKKKKGAEKHEKMGNRESPIKKSKGSYYGQKIST